MWIGKKHTNVRYIYYTVLVLLLISSTMLTAESDSIDTGLFKEGAKYADILKTSPEWRSRLSQMMMSCVEEAKLEPYLLDIAVVGSFAFGCARGNWHYDPSDIDLAIILEMDNLQNLPDSIKKDKDAILSKWGNKISSELNFVLKPDLLLIACNESYPLKGRNNVYFSLSEDKMHGRETHQPLFIKMVWHEGCWYHFDRDKWLQYEKRWTPDLKIERKVSGDKRLQLFNKETGELLIESRKNDNIK